ncbi:START domain-containing protein [Pokkaliibacter plantistimulans]|nr:START domain-containing protein [Pokkaliibacter plantistimulans]
MDRQVCQPNGKLKTPAHLQQLRQVSSWLALILLCGISTARAEPWTLWRTTNNVTVQYRQDNQHRFNVRAETELTTSLAAFVAMLQDTEHASDWISQVKSVTLLQHDSDQEDVVKTRFKGTLLVHERWAVTRSILSQDSHQVLTLSIHNRYDPQASETGIQIRYLQARWTLTPLANGKVQIRYQGSIDPDGMIPGWLVRQHGLQVVLETFIHLRQQIKLPRYQHAHLPFITEP